MQIELTVASLKWLMSELYISGLPSPYAGTLNVVAPIDMGIGGEGSRPCTAVRAIETVHTIYPLLTTNNLCSVALPFVHLC